MSDDGLRIAIGTKSSNHVRVYRDADGVWTQVGSDIDGVAAGDKSGSSVAMSGDGSRIAIGASNNDGNGVESGHVRVYREVDGDWTQVGSDIDGEAAYDYSGRSVAMSDDGSRIAVGALYNDGNGVNSGHVRVYREVDGVWTQVGSDIDGEAAGDYSGVSVAMSDDGSRIAIGAAFNDGNGVDSGHVRVYHKVDGDWTQVGSDIDGEAAGDYSGRWVAMSGNGLNIAIGAAFNDGSLGFNSGHVRVYREVDGDWTQVGSDINGEAAGDRSGSVAMSDDGSRIAIGAAYNDGNGVDSGHVRVYHKVDGDWTQVGSDIDGEAADDKSGWSVAISGNGLRVAIGATFSRHVRVFEL